MLTSKVKSSEVTSMACFEPLSFIKLIETKNTAVYSDSVSTVSRKMHLDLITAQKQQLRIENLVMWQDSAYAKKMRKDIQSLLDQCVKYETPDSVHLPARLDSVLEASKTRFGLVVVANGFTRTKDNYSKEVAKAVATGIATMGLYSRVPIKANSSVYAIIVDSKENNVAFYRVNELKGKDPLDVVVLQDQYKKIFKGYFPK
jgi:hypothetical protein